MAAGLSLLMLPLQAAPDDSIHGPGGHGHNPGGPAGSFHVDVPAHTYDLLLCRPENNSITASVLAYQDSEGFIAYGTAPDALTAKTPAQKFTSGTPTQIELDQLLPNTRYYYRFSYRAPGASTFTEAPANHFQTARPPGSTFTFTLTADAHLDEHTSADVYNQTLANIHGEDPDFHIDLGNLFMTDKHKTRGEAAKQYLAQRYYLGQIGGSTPILLALGTHDGEDGRYEDGTADCLAAWSYRLRTTFYPNPVPDSFYSGNTQKAAYCGPLQDYYSFTWGDALFVVLDPFRYSTREQGGGDGWGWSLGRTQYQWLEQTLAQSHARFKFVFIHNLLIGDQAARGGTEVAALNEWGGKNADGTDGFAQHRPGWDMPVAKLLAQNHVAILFKAHDNFYARQSLDGIVYNMVPQPSFAGDDRIRDLTNYGYKQGVFLGNSGHVRVTVSPDKVTVDYVKSSPASAIQDSYVIKSDDAKEPGKT
jgi:hypothetical protein